MYSIDLAELVDHEIDPNVRDQARVHPYPVEVIAQLPLGRDDALPAVPEATTSMRPVLSTAKNLWRLLEDGEWDPPSVLCSPKQKPSPDTSRKFRDASSERSSGMPG